jgi:DNA-binding SARP family transcriptional activator/tetratricopeptide (TPR) repeat protein
VLFRLLGPLRLDVPTAEVDLGPDKQRCLLVALLLSPGQPVPVEVLADRVWGDGQPRQVRNVLSTYVTRLRRAIESAGPATRTIKLRHADGGYLVDCTPEQVDLYWARGLVREARMSGDDARAALLCQRALADWQPVALAGISGTWAERTREGLLQQRFSVVSDWAKAELRMGRAGVVVDELRDLVASHPMVEEIAALFIAALAYTGRAAQALDCYARVRHAIAEELGADPGAELQDLHRAILRGEIEVSPSSGPVRGPVAPAQLPPDVRGFSGRRDELAQLDEALRAAGEQPTAVVISALSGTAGVGKTALAVHWAHMVRDRFPDGQLYVNLRGFDESGSVTSPAEALRGFLDAFDVPPQRIPAGLDAQAALYRSLLAGKLMLIVLDNARDAGQVRPMLPGTAGCLVVITSRNQLSGLLAMGARSLTLDLVSAAEARELLAHRVGESRVAAEFQAADDIAALCARLPLALSIVAARAATQPGFRLATLADTLRETHGSLDAFDGGDPATDARAVFSWSYDTLKGDGARLFRLLGLHPGVDIAVPAAASLAGAAVRQLLAELSRANLVIECAPGRYTFHDLLRAYAAELAHTLDSEVEQRRALHRVLDHYLHSAYAAAMLLDPYRDPITPAAPLPGVTLARLADHEHALAWFTGERTNVLAIIEFAARSGFDTHAWQLAWTFAEFLDRRGYWREGAASQHIALESARRMGDRSGQAYANRSLGLAHDQLGHHDEAHTCLRAALDLFCETVDLTGEARTHLSLGQMLERQGQHPTALGHSRRALALFQAAGHRPGQASALNAVGWRLAVLGDHQQALSYCEQALTLLREIGDRYGEAGTWDSLGYAHHHLGHREQAITCFQNAIGLFSDLGDRYHEAAVLTNLGDTHHANGDRDNAHRTWEHALHILTELGHADADKVRAKLAAAGDTHRGG